MRTPSAKPAVSTVPRSRVRARSMPRTTGLPWGVMALAALAALFLAGCGASAPETAESAAPVVPEAYADAFTPFDGDAPQLEDYFISVHDVAGALDAGMDIVFIDARPELDYEFGAIEGAINIPYFEVEEHLDKVPQDRWLVTYCECPHHEAGQAAEELYQAGFIHVKVLEEGLAGWRDELGRPLVMPPSGG